MHNGKIKVLFLQTNNSGVAFYRLYQFAQRMSELGLAHSRMYPPWDVKNVVMRDWENDFKETMPVLTEMVDWADIVVIQYIHSDKGLSIVQAVRDLKPTLMEADDYFSQVPCESIAYDSNMPGYAQDIWATRQIIESHGVITTTEYLKNHYQKWNKKVHVAPNCIDFDMWDQYKTHSNEKIRIGWIGGDTHQGDLKMVKDALYAILDKYPNVEVYIICGNPPAWEKHDRLNLVATWASIMDYPKMVKDFSFDIGIVPLKDNYFNRGKSNLKYLEYSACKIPTVASNVEPFRKDFAGILTENSDDEWINSISKLVEDQDYRLQMGSDGYLNVKEKFNLNNIAIQYADCLKGYCYNNM